MVHSVLSRTGLLAAVSAFLFITSQQVLAGDVISDGPSAKVNKNLAVASIGARPLANVTADVWALGNYAYTGTSAAQCGGDPESGVWVWDVHNHNRAEFVGIIPSPPGSFAADMAAATMNSGDILVHTNQLCASGGPGGLEVYDVSDPTAPTFLSSIRIDELNPISDALFGGLTDLPTSGVFLFTQGDRDYVAAVANGGFDNFRIYDITDPTTPTLVSAWGAEEIFDPGVGDETADTGRVLNAALWLIDGFGTSRNRFLSDITISEDGQRAYLANWDAGLVLLDISDPTSPQLVSQALQPASGDGEVNSASAWPSADGTIVVESEEDFSAFETLFSITTGPAAGEYPAQEGAITTPIGSLPGQTMAGPTVYVGFACDADVPIPAAPSADSIALILRGVCTFSEKIDNAEDAGYAGIVMMNDEARGDALVTMGGDPTNLPGVFVGHSTGLAVAAKPDQASLVIGDAGEDVSAARVANAWGGLRVWDYTDPANPVLASTFNTLCGGVPDDPSCDPASPSTARGVVVDGTKAYVAWSREGVVAIDVSDPYGPVEFARFADDSQAFIDANGGNPHDFLGVYKRSGQPWIYASDRNGGLYVLKEYGAGSEKKGKQ